MCVLSSGYTCALQRDMLYQGKMFVSQNWICFHSKVFGKDIKVCYRKPAIREIIIVSNPDQLALIVFPFCQISIPVMSVKLLKKTKTALLVPNALVIGTTEMDVRKLYNLCPFKSTNLIVTLSFLSFTACLCVVSLSKQHL